jgi:hypothetical protein
MEVIKSRRRAGVDKSERWRQRLSEWKRSGLRPASYCRRHGLSEATFYWWKRRLCGVAPRKPAQAQAPQEAVGRRSTFIPVRLKESAGGAAAGARWACEVVVPSGVRLRLREHPGLGRLRKLAAALLGA